MTYYKATKQDFESVADAIREKTGRSAKLEFPTEFVSEIGSISGGGGVPTISRDDWDNLTAQQKKSYGLVGIVDSDTGYLRGELVNGADYIPIGIYIPYSNSGKVVCEAYKDYFDQDSDVWGAGNSPLVLNNKLATIVDDSVYLEAKAKSTWASVDLGSTSTPFTAYIVAKADSGNSNYFRLISCFAGRSGGNGIMLYGDPATVSSWGDDTSTGIGSKDWFVGAIQFTRSGEAFGAAANINSVSPNYVYKTPGSAGRYVTVARTDIGSSFINAEPSDLFVRYVAVVKDAEDASIVSQNMMNLVSVFLPAGS